MEGRVLADRYELENVVGEGGMATVWRARDRRLERPVAVKILGERFTTDQEFRARFTQEARAAASFSHPNVVDVLDYGDEDGTPYIVMELIEGEDLGSILARNKRLPADEVARIGAEVSRGLAAAHRRGLVHRDIKPANILVAEDGTPKLADFGIVRAIGTATMTRAGTTLGSVHYLSPEQVQGASVDGRSDIYALGVVLYEAATGERPFDGDAPAAIAVRRLSEAPRPPHAVEPSIPAGLSAVIERALARDPARRYPTAADFERDLRNYRSLDPAAVAARGSRDATAALNLPVPVAGPRAAAVARPRATPRRRAEGAPLFFLGLLIGLVLLAAGAFLLWAPNAFAFIVPDVVGMDRNAAIGELRAHGLQPNVVPCDPRPEPAGEVYRQEPAPPRFVRTGQFVDVYYSCGPAPVAIPSLRLLTVDEAKAALEAVGLKLGQTEQRFDEFVEADKVIESIPSAGIPLPPGSEVDLLVSSGPRPTPTPTPTPEPTPTPTPPPTPPPTTPPPTASPTPGSSPP